MNESPAAADWAAARGEKRRAQLAGMEAMLTPVDEPLIRALNLDVACRIADIGSRRVRVPVGGTCTRVGAGRPCIEGPDPWGADQIQKSNASLDAGPTGC